MFAKKYCYFLFHAGDNLHRVVLCANQYATDHVNGGGCLILFVFIFLHFAQLSTFSQYSESVHSCCVQNLDILPCARQCHWSSRSRMLIFIWLWLFSVLVFSVVRFAQFAEWVHWRCVQNLHILLRARQCHWSSRRDEIAPRLHQGLTGQHLYQACTSG